MRGIWLAPVLVLGLVVATAPARGADHAGEGTGQPAAPVPLRVEPASAPSPSEGRSEEFEGRPGRDNPEEFYKKPPRKPKQKSRMHA